jgi:hypothetical protein
MTKSAWIKAGEISVDAGIVMVGDPCYLADDIENHPVKDWNNFCEMLDQPIYATDVKYPTIKQLDFAAGHKGLGVVVSSGYGDGVYPVYVKKNSEGRIVELKVKFD